MRHFPEACFFGALAIAACFTLYCVAYVGFGSIAPLL